MPSLGDPTGAKDNRGESLRQNRKDPGKRRHWAAVLWLLEVPEEEAAS